MTAPFLYVDIYTGQSRARAWIERMERYGWGEMTCRGELPARRHPYAYDNGAFKDWRAGKPFDADAFQRDLDFLALHARADPRFIVCPDIVAGGAASFDFSMSWALRLRGRAPLYLAVQDGMTAPDIGAWMRRDAGHADGCFAGLFVGGTLDWKLKTAKRWVDLAHEVGWRCHVGRVGTENRVRWAKRIGADSIDSCLPLWSEENLQRFMNGLAQDPNLEMEFDP